MITDEILKDFLISVKNENIAKFSITNANLSDLGVTYIAQFFAEKNNLHVLKLYNNIMRAI